MADAAQHTAKPGLSCLCCKRRKLKCSREAEGCINCQKADLPCVYPTAETGVKRKRGPYKKKDRPAREAHVEHVVRYLSNPVATKVDSRSPSGSSGSQFYSQVSHSPADAGQHDQAVLSTTRTTASEDLVKDALIALTRTSVSTLESSENHPRSKFTESSAQKPAIRVSGQSDIGTTNPSIKHVFELWHLFTTRVDPLTRLLHIPTFTPKLFELLENPEPGARQTLCHSVYFAAISSCSATEARQRFGESKESLLRRYGQAIEVAVANSYGTPSMELMQALLIHLVCVRRGDHESGQWTLFALALRNAELMGLMTDPGHKFRPAEAEMRRRMWWTICGLETRRGEEGATKPDSITAYTTVHMPLNIDDRDLWLHSTEVPPSRNGITEMSFVLVRWNIQRMMHRLWAIRRTHSNSDDEDLESNIRNEQIAEFKECKERLQTQYLDYCHPSRAFDQMLLALVEVMMVPPLSFQPALLPYADKRQTKALISINYPWNTSTITKSMTAEQRMYMLRSSVVIIEYTHSLHAHEQMRDWLWYFRGFVQASLYSIHTAEIVANVSKWHSLAIVVAELGHSTNGQFVKSAWAALEPWLESWNNVYESKQGDPAWDHVNSLISRSKAKASQAQAADSGVSKRVPLPAFYSLGDKESYRLAADQESPASASTGSLSSAPPNPDQDMPGQQQFGGKMHLPYPTADPAFSFTSDMANFDIDMSFDYLPEPLDFEALNAVFTSPSWEMANPAGGFDMEMI